MMRSSLTITVVALLAVVTGTVAARQQNPYRLKDPDQRKLCLACHTDFDQALKKRFVHTPLRTGDCAGCHDPHTSSHGRLLSRDPRHVCEGCHDGLVSASDKSRHQVVADGECQKCHEAHASDNPANLKARGNELCVGCHKQLGEAIKVAKFKHGPVDQGCLTCHAPHSSAKAPSLLKNAVPSLCLNCHKADTPAFQARHMNYPVAKATCTSCHDPHGSNQAALLLNNVHQPVRAGTCNRCHDLPDSASPFSTKRTGFELCKGCHNDMVEGVMAKGHLHWPVADKRGCLNCHNPHASNYPKLLYADGAKLCGRCHADTLQRIAGTTVKHAPAGEGSCTACHSPHGAQGSFLVDQASMTQLCATCHDYQKHSAHPIGEKAVDPRDKNLRVECLSCHRGHGTPFKRMLLTETTAELCTKCHKKYVR